MACNMIVNEIKQQSYFQKVVLFFIASIFCAPKFTTIIGVFVFGFFIYTAIKNKNEFRLNKSLAFFICLYLLYILGISLSNDITSFKHIVESKFVFLLLPIVFSIGKHNNYEFKTIHFTIVFSIIVYFLYGIYNGFTCYLKSELGDPYYGTFYFFTRGVLSPFTHPTYDSAYTFLGVLSTLILLKNRILNRYLSIFILLFLSLKIILLFSFSGVLFYFAFILFSFFWFLQKRWNKLISITIIAFSSLVLILIFDNISALKRDVNETKNASLSYISNPNEFIKRNKKPPSGTVTRIIMWKISFDLIKEKPLGYGVGDVMKTTNAKLKEYGHEEMIKHNLNSHNQYLQMGLELGVLPMLFFIGWGLYLLIKSWREENYFLFFILLNLLFNCLFESMLQRQSGIVFYTFFICLFLKWNDKKNQFI